MIYLHPALMSTLHADNFIYLDWFEISRQLK